LANLDTYHYEKTMNANGIRLAGAFQGKDGNKYVVFKKDQAILGVNIGRVVGTAGGSLVSTNGGNILVNGGGSFVPGATLIAQGGGNLVGQDGAGVIAQGGGNVIAQGGGNMGRRIQAAGETSFQFPNRYAVVSGRR
jgi:hypothetical protein